MKNKGKFDKSELSKFGINLDGKESEKMFGSAESVDYASNATPDRGQRKVRDISISGENDLYMTQPKMDFKKGSIPITDPANRRNHGAARTP